MTGRQASYSCVVTVTELESRFGTQTHLFFLMVFPESLPFSICKSGEVGSRGDGDLGLDHRGPSFPQKGITKQQEEGIRMVQRVMVSLEGEDGLDEIYSFR